ncbi:sugar ABC transporter substrate-binding protein [Paenibacillus sp. PCH8]|uniref:sugar ABC transporter substrate-binding protein n=1 Tax=Paenibacillus sp. PCH8 TaxID=2066524 RepID=UPI000CF8ACC0|nr:substrate-binding domain-containing protein [Paenibacillus sp. PCH8]PQP80749.1 sugar ABC transporter substrate-binding protein [Paenibacillus sp. PCH8]
MNKFKSVLLLILMMLLAMVITSGSIYIHPKQQAITPHVTTSMEKSTKGKTFGIIYPMTYPTYEMITMDATESAGKHNITLAVNAPDEANTEQQIRIMENMIKQNVDGIAISPVDATALTPVINKAQAAGIPVITFESDAPSSHRTAYVGADNYRTGRQFAMTTTKLLNNQGMILVENGLEDMQGLQQRLNGFIDYISNETAIEILDVKYNQGNEDRAMDDMENMIHAHPHFNAIVGLDFVSVSASTLIWKAKGLKRHLIAFGDSPTSENGLLNGQLSAVISQNEGVWGAKMIETLFLASEGLPVEEFIDTGITELNQEGSN